MKVISVRQPWAFLLMLGKDIENRSWGTLYRGPIGIHASKAMSKSEWVEVVSFVAEFDPRLAASIPPPDSLVRGAIIGTMHLGDCVTQSDSPWFQGPYGFVMGQPKPCDPIYVTGKLGLWNWEPKG